MRVCPKYASRPVKLFDYFFIFCENWRGTYIIFRKILTGNE